MTLQVGLKRVAAELELAKNAKLVSNSQGIVAIKTGANAAARVQIAAGVVNDDAVNKGQLDAALQAIQDIINNLQNGLEAGDGIDALALANNDLAVKILADAGLKFVDGSLAVDLAPEISSTASTSKPASARTVFNAIDAAKLTIHPDSTGVASINAQNQLTIGRILLSEVIQDTTSTSLTQAIASLGSRPVEQGDVLVLNAADPQLIYIRNGGTSGTVNDWTQLNTPGINTAQIRALLSVAAASGDVLSYNPTTGELGFIANEESFVFTEDGLTVRSGGVKQSHIDFGTATNQVNAADLPVMAYAWAAITNPASSQDALQKLDAAVAAVVTSVTGLANTKANQSDLVALQNSVQANENDIAALDVRMDTAEGTIATTQTSVVALSGRVTDAETAIAALQATPNVRYMAIEFNGAGVYVLGSLPANARLLEYRIHLDTASPSGTLGFGSVSGGNPTPLVDQEYFDASVAGEDQIYEKISGKVNSIRPVQLLAQGVAANTSGMAIVKYLMPMSVATAI